MIALFKKRDEAKEKELKILVDGIDKIIDSLRNEKTSNIRLTDSRIDKYGTKTISLSGGLNGWGEWDKYFKDLSKIVKKVNEEYRMWLIEMDNDCLDDLFYGTFGVDFKKDKNG